jgi:glycosyltransferase involved in cell wall biosynthesis
LLRRLRTNKRAGLIDAHFAYPSGYAAVVLGRWLGLPVSITLRGTESVHLRTPRLRRRVLAAVNGATRVFSVSDSLRRLLTGEGVDADRITVIGNGIDLGKFHRLDRADARRQFGLPPKARILVSVGALIERKGFHRVIELLPHLRRKFPDLHYLIVGGPGPAGDIGWQLREQVTRLGLGAHVTFAGALSHDRVGVAMCAADVFVLATRYEGWANVLLEAMACGLPVVTTRVGGNEEVVSSDQLGILVPFDDRQSLENALEDALTRHWDRDAIVDHARRNTWEDRVALLTRNLADVAARARSGARAA